MSEHNAQVGSLYTAKEVADRLRVSIITVYRWTRNGALKEGADFFVLPHVGKRRSVRFTEVQYNQIIGNPPSQA